MPGEGTVRPLTDLFVRLGMRRPEPDSVSAEIPATVDADPVFPTKAFQKFLSCLSGREAPVLLDLGPVVGSNVSFFGERLGCKIFVEDLYAEVDTLARQQRLEELPGLIETRFSQGAGSVDGILCWDLIDYLDRAAAQALARELTRILRPTGALLGFFATTESPLAQYTKYVIVDDLNLRHRPYPAAQVKRRALLNRDIIRLFGDLRVSDSFLLTINIREILFRKPAAVPAGVRG